MSISACGVCHTHVPAGQTSLRVCGDDSRGLGCRCESQVPVAKHVYQQLGAALRVARERASLTQAELGRRVGLSRTSITNMERGRQVVLVHQLLALSLVLDVAAVDLLPDTAALFDVSTADTSLPEDITELMGNLSVYEAEQAS